MDHFENCEFELTPDADIDCIEVNSKLVEVILRVISVDAIITVGKREKYQVFKFLLSNNSNRIIQGAVWGNDIKLFTEIIKLGNVVHINGAWSGLANQHFNRGNVQVELTLKEGTDVTVLSGSEDNEFLDKTPIEVELKDSVNHTELLSVKGYIKSKFQQITTTYGSYGLGAITDGDVRLDVRVSAYNTNHQLIVGNFIKLIGIMNEDFDSKTGRKNYSIVVKSMEDIEKLDGYMPSFKMIKAVQSPKRKCTSPIQSTADNCDKKQKMDS